MNILIIGAGGQLGNSLARSLHSFQPTCLLKHELELGDIKALEKAFKGYKPEIVINCAAYTNVDMAEQEMELANNVNHKWLAELVLCCNAYQATLIHFSTDYVFNGKALKPYKEQDKPDPINVYGKTKLEGDLHIISNARKFFIFRVSWLYSYTHKSFFQTMLKLVSKQNIFSVVNDQFGRPTSANHISDFIKHLIDHGLYKNKFGLYNFSSNGPIISWLDFAQYIFKQAYNMGHISEEPVIKKLGEYQYKAKRPRYSALSNAMTQRTFKFQIQDWRTSTKNEIESFYKVKE